MKKQLFLSVFSLFLFCGITFAQELTLEDVLQNHFKAVGAEKLANMKSVVAVGKVISQGMEMPFVQKIKSPDKIRTEVEIQGSKMVQAFNGTVGWMVAPFFGTDDPQDMSEDQISQYKEQADLQGKLWNWKDKVASLELVGKEDMEGTEVYKLKLVDKDQNPNDDNPVGDTRYIYIDAESFVILKTTFKLKVQGIDMEMDIIQSNYKEVDGILMPFGMETIVNGKGSDQVTIDSYTFNTDIADSEFDKPIKNK
jgi:outer membrane lipoprotein-sorting protein